MKQDFVKLREYFDKYEYGKLRSTHDGVEDEHIIHYETRILPYFKKFKNLRILDIGCGDGVITKKFADKYPENSYIGVDLSKAQIDIAIKNFGSSNLSFFQADVSKGLTNIDGVFDLIYSFSVIQYFDEEFFTNLTHNLKSKLNKGGVIIHMSIPDKDFFWKDKIDIGPLAPLKIVSKYPYLIIQYLKNIYSSDGSYYWDRKRMKELLRDDFDVHMFKADSFYRFDVVLKRNDK